MSKKGNTIMIKDEKAKLVIELYNSFMSLSSEEKKRILDCVKTESPKLYPALKKIAENK